MIHRGDFPRFSARTVRCRDARNPAGHCKACATLSESCGKPPPRSRMKPVGGRRKTLPMPSGNSGIACGSSPTRRTAYAISMGHYQCSLVLEAR
jgi:hypothetical protein